MEKGRYNILNFKLYYIIQGNKKMELKISNLIKNEELNNYANGKKLNYKTLIDCSDGKNPYGCSKNILHL